MRRDWRQRAPRRGRWESLAIVLIAALTCACGGGDPAGPDGGSAPDASVDPDATVFPACAEIAAPLITIAAADLPRTVEGDLAGAGADLLSPVTCDTIEAPFGIESAGVDAAVAVTGLEPGAEYVVRLDGDDDLAFYVVTGCSTATGPAPGECLLYVDAATDRTELGRFVAPQDGGDVFVVVDYYAASAPADGAFTLEVYRAECSDFEPSACGGATPACLESRCVGCVSDWDCDSAATPLCNETDHVCVAGFGLCTGDDGAENGDDGPAGATLMPSGVTLVGGICNNPTFERDFHRFRVDGNGEHWLIELGWSASVDLDLVIYDAAGDIVGMSFYEQPEGVELTYLPAGDYYAMVDSYAPTQTSVSTSYAIRATQTGAGSCTSSADCAIEYRNQVFRGDCSAGACQRIDGQGMRASGERCDSDSDCSPAASCSSFYFVADADERMVCGDSCTGDADCAGLGSDYVCTTYLEDNFCVQKCTSNDHCPALPYSQPLTDPWLRFGCQLSTGRCQPP